MSETAIARPALAAPNISGLLRVLAVPALGILSFAAAMTLVPSDRAALVGLSIATATLILTVIAFDRARPRERRNLLLTIFSFSYFVFFVLPAFVFYVGEVGYIHDMSPNPSPVPLTPADVTRGALAVLLGYMALLGGYALPIGKVASRIVPRMRREWSAETTIAVAMMMIPIGWSVLIAGQLRLIPRDLGNGVLGILASGTSLGIGLLAICYQRYRSRAALMLIALAIPPTMFFNFFTSSKMLFVLPIVMIVVVHVIVTRRLRLWWIIGFLVLMALFYPVANFYRHLLYGSTVENRFILHMLARPLQIFSLLASFVSAAPLADYLWTGLDATVRRLDGLSILTVIIRDTGVRTPFQGGWSLAQIPMAYIPRFLWPEKPLLGLGGYITETYGYGPGIESATGCGWMGELYMNFGWLGILFGMTLIGMFMRFLQESFLSIDATIPAMLAGVVSLLTLSSNVGGDLLSTINGIIFALAPLMIMHLVVRTLTPVPARLPPPL